MLDILYLVNYNFLVKKVSDYHARRFGKEVNMNSKIEELKRIIKDSNYIVFFGGAGVSTESGVPDFRSVDGLYNQNYKYPPETILSHTFFMKKTEEFYRFYKEKMLFKGVEPNDAHKVLAKLEKMDKVKAVITQNIDGLHQMAGSRNVYELHGSVHRNYCMKCKKFYGFDYMYDATEIPKCDCGGTIKPDVVLYEEGLDDNIVNEAINHICKADTLIIGGTSLVVYPAAGLIRYFSGKNLVLINKSETSVDNKANLVINDSIGKVLSEVAEL